MCARESGLGSLWLTCFHGISEISLWNFSCRTRVECSTWESNYCTGEVEENLKWDWIKTSSLPWRSSAWWGSHGHACTHCNRYKQHKTSASLGATPCGHALIFAPVPWRPAWLLQLQGCRVVESFPWCCLNWLYRKGEENLEVAPQMIVVPVDKPYLAAGIIFSNPNTSPSEKLRRGCSKKNKAPSGSCWIHYFYFRVSILLHSPGLLKGTVESCSLNFL